MVGVELSLTAVDEVPVVPDDVVLERLAGLALQRAAGGPTGQALAGQFQRVAADSRRRRRQCEMREAVVVPTLCLFSVTPRCNLHCTGCYAPAHAVVPDLSPAAIRARIMQMVSSGTAFFFIAGGEPLLVEGLLPLLAELPDAFFFLFSNGTLLSEREVGSIARAGNILPVLSAEGDRALTDERRGAGVGDAVFRAMALCRAAGLPFAVSTMLTRRNLRLVTACAWFKVLRDAGAVLNLLIDYHPCGAPGDQTLVLGESDRELARHELAARLAEAGPLPLWLPHDELRSGGCRAKSGDFVHLRADGRMELCPFIARSSENMTGKTYLETVKQLRIQLSA